ncbi:hypothetical protein PZA11_007095 [Diplocarpon coronariae]|uniref:Monooxygenase n=1 Tax=Diplocarpon coronariae TaxID=2795749 RepID=A0A218YY54_9HELO|nr:monooxygenase [Diplocarpon mali]OWP00320.1 monooxygenase [Marssonina coronariae]
MSSDQQVETTDVLIVGCGPTGALLTTLLGRFGVQNLVLEKAPGITDDPRGVFLDEDGLRLLQEIGRYDKIYTEIGSPPGMIKFITSRDDLHERPFLKFNMDTTEGGTGHVGGIVHRQPMLEKHLRLAAAKHPSSELRSSCTVTHIEEDADWVHCTYADASGAERRVRSKFLVGCDGKRGFTRKLYLEPRGVLMEQASSFGYNETWVAINLRLTAPTPASHPELPFWRLGYTPAQVYDLYFPPHFRFVCNDYRAVVCGRFGIEAELYWRLEFVVRAGEDAAYMASEKQAMQIVMPYLTHDGAAFGCAGSEFPFPSDCLEIIRSRPFVFSARSCNRWAVGRVMLAGDSAHVFPPFGGQGISSGFRDSSGLAWRLAIAIREDSSNHAHLLAGWYRERQQQLRISLAKTVTNGSLCTQGNTWRFALTKLLLSLLQMIPSMRRKIEVGPRAEGMIRYKHEPGLPFLGDSHGGMSLPQVYCAPLCSDAQNPRVMFTDDAIFREGKKGLFQVLVLLDSLAGLSSIRAGLEGLEKLSGGYVEANEVTFLLQQAYIDDIKAGEGAGPDVYRLATADEFAATEELVRGRPAPVYYNMHQIRKDVEGMRFVVARPDRFVYAACETVERLREICAGIRQELGV